MSVRLSLAVAVLVLCILLPVRPISAADSTLTATLQGKVVQFEMSGFEPDFDPIDRVVIDATLHDRRAGSAALPDVKLVISAYLENFQPETTPTLPDLLHPNQAATSLGGFMHGKIALVNAAGRITYNGSVLAETFLDNTVHYILDLYGRGAADTGRPLRLRGSFTLYKNLTIHGQAQATRALAPAEVTSLRVARGRAVSWQSIVRGLSVPLPPMMGTGGTGRPPVRSAPVAAPGPPWQWIAPAVGLVMAGVVILLLWQRRHVALLYRSLLHRRSLAGESGEDESEVTADPLRPTDAPS